MSEEELEKLAFADIKKLKNLNEIDLLTIIEFLQIDRKQWIKEYSNVHNKSIDLQQQLQQKDEIIDEAIEYINTHTTTFEPEIDNKELLDILVKYKGDNNG